MATSLTTSSPFLTPTPFTEPNTLAIIHQKRGLQTPVVLRSYDDKNEGYAEGKVLNTRFGSFPHSTLINLPWGSQVRASHVDTGSRGKKNKKRKRNVADEAGAENEGEGGEGGTLTTSTTAVKEAVTATSGFVYILPPTPENWTLSLPHRTQVVYTPDYSYILHRLRVRPGSRIIEAGAGSGSFSHAAARAVFSGYPFVGDAIEGDTVPKKRQRRTGKVYSYEFHAPRYESLCQEIKDHGLEDIIQITHRDVCKDGFLVGEHEDESPEAEAIFLDLPAPWIALPHLSRRPKCPPSFLQQASAKQVMDMKAAKQTEDITYQSPLSSTAPIHLCTFSPCIEQVQRTVSTLRRLGWVDISMVEVSNKHIDIRRENIGLDVSPLERWGTVAPASVDEAVQRLREVEVRFKDFHTGNPDRDPDADDISDAEESQKKKPKKRKDNVNALGLSREAQIEEGIAKKLYKKGRLVHRSEPEVKTHTSYLVFAILPREWSAEDEERAQRRWERKEKQKPVGQVDE